MQVNESLPDSGQSFKNTKLLWEIFNEFHEGKKVGYSPLNISKF